MLPRPLRRPLRVLVVSLIVIVFLAYVLAVLRLLGTSDPFFTLPEVLTGAAVLFVVGGGAAAVPQMRGPVVLRSHVAARTERGRFEFAVQSVLFGFLFFGLALSFSYTSFPGDLVAIAVLVPTVLLTLDTASNIIGPPKVKTG